MNGRRLQTDSEGWLPPNFEPGDYGRCTHPDAIGNRIGWWQVCAPDGSNGSISPEKHTVVEHEDRTITVSPSLDFSQRRAGAWHGWLERGVWRSV